MTFLLFTLILFVGSLLAGLIGALTGLGGGVIIVPLLVLGLGVDLKYAVGASLVAVIATSSGAAAAYVREGFTNLRLAMLLEISTALGAIGGALLATSIPPGAIGILFGVVLLFTAWSVTRPPRALAIDSTPDPLATRLRLHAAFPADGQALLDGERRTIPYFVHHVPAGMSVMALGGTLAGLTGLGAGVVKVLAMDRIMKVPFKVSTTTSNFMIGVTAAAGAGVYFARGQIDPAICFPIVLGVTIGALVGARLLPKIRTQTLRRVFAVVVAAIGIQMIVRALTGSL